MRIVDVLRKTSFGERVAEEEGDSLEEYFVETDQWRRIFEGKVDVIYGPKGSGKSALYYLLLRKAGELNQRGVDVISGENPRGETAFRHLVVEPPTSEREFVQIWKLYVATLIGRWFIEKRYNGQKERRVVDALKRSRILRETTSSLESVLRNVQDYIRRFTQPGTLQAGVTLGEFSGAPTGMTVSLSLDGGDSEPAELNESIDSLLKLANQALEDRGVLVWVALDRLDNAFAESRDLEENGLRALFQAYLDMRQIGSIVLKIFLRDDIWKRITRHGFREASHITKHTTIEWGQRSLLNLIVRRAIQSERLREF